MRVTRLTMIKANLPRVGKNDVVKMTLRTDNCANFEIKPTLPSYFDCLID